MVYVNNSPFYQADSLFVTIRKVDDGIFESTSVFDDGLSIPPAKNYLQPCNNSVYQASDLSLQNKQEVYRLDGNVGDNWQAAVTTFGGNQAITTFSIAAKDISVSVPAGTFKCIQIHGVTVLSGQTIESNTIIHDEKGIVKATGTTISYELSRTSF